jgi:hypothetical protein
MGTPKGTVPWNAGTSQGWTDKRGYRWRYVVQNGKRRAIREHRYVMAQSLGRTLEPWEVVHHRDGNPLNNDLSNLELIEVGEHTYQHHNGSQRTDNAKKSLRIFAQMREEIRHLRGVNAALLEALVAAERALSAASIADKSLYAAPVTLAARAAIRATKGESA